MFQSQLLSRLSHSSAALGLIDASESLQSSSLLKPSPSPSMGPVLVSVVHSFSLSSAPEQAARHKQIIRLEMLIFLQRLAVAADSVTDA